jgi:hypothetical protein
MPLYARDLQPGMTVPLGFKLVTVQSVTVMDGTNGEPPQFIGGELKLAAALKIEFSDHESIITHPGSVVLENSTN